MLDEIRSKLSPKDVKYFKLAVWAALLTWVVSFVTISFFVARGLDHLGTELFAGMFGQIIGFFWATAYVLTVFYIVVLMVRWANKKLRG